KTDLANSSIPTEYIVKDGDILFSWSGSLEVVIWCGGEGALNQHLFKVTSETYPKWFYYYWTLHHLMKFKGIAADKATTMGHIKRTHLSEAKVLVPPKQEMEELSQIFIPIVNKIININLEIRSLRKTRDLLLPKLMSGKIRVPIEVKI
ncbi:MAG: restriction endonuclease subunit S, partial [Candidatus Nanoarchaeia archaeon]